MLISSLHLCPKMQGTVWFFGSSVWESGTVGVGAALSSQCTPVVPGEMSLLSSWAARLAG